MQVSTEIKTQILNMYLKQNKSITEICKKIYNSEQTHYRERCKKIIQNEINIEEYKKFKNNIRLKTNTNRMIKLPIEEMFRLHFEEKLSAKEIAKKFNVSYGTIQKRFKEANVKLIHKGGERYRLHKDAIEKIKRLWDEGYDIPYISKQVKRGEWTVKLYLREYFGYTTKFRSQTSKSLFYEERITKELLESKNIKVLKCFYICQRKDKTPIPNEFKEFCLNCPVKKLKFYDEFKEFYDFICIDESGYFICEVKTINKKKYIKHKNMMCHFSSGQFMNISKIIRANIRIKIVLVLDNKIIEYWL